MMGQGPAPRPKTMVVGEAPGAQEDMEAVPFVGPSGQLLDEVLAKVGIDRHEDCYVTNVAKRRPPGDATPSRSDINIRTTAYLG